MDIEKCTREFQDKTPTYDHLEGEALYIIKLALEQTDIKLHSITSRVKKLGSFLDKIQRKQSSNPFEEIQDIVGLRVICLFLSDISRIRDAIRSSFSVLAEDNKIEGADVSSFGYMSVHFIVMMKPEYVGPRYDHIANMAFEIQVRTIAMDAWANVSHHLEYKSEMDVPTDLRRDFYALSGLFYVADKHFEMFFRSSSESREKMVEAFSDIEPPLDQEVNLDSLAAYLLNKFPDRTHGDAKSLSALISELSGVGIRYISEIDRNIDRTSEAFGVYEKEHPPFSAPGRKYADIGVVRAVFDVTNREFREIRQKKGDLRDKDFKRYEDLLKDQ
jgi:putative GTP pyrophosphokinase